MSKSSRKSAADENDSVPPLASNEAVRIFGKRPRTVGILWYRGTNLVLLALTPVGLGGIAIGATTVILRLADPSVHVAGILAVWISSTIVSGMAIVAGWIAARDLARDANHSSTWKQNWARKNPRVNSPARLRCGIQLQPRM
jgi:hypothetical protein